MDTRDQGLPCGRPCLRRSDKVSKLLFGITRRPLTFLVLLCAADLIAGGCVSQRAANNIAYGVTERLFGKKMDIPFWADAFREDKGRLPHDYAELSQFVSRQTDSRVQLEPYAQVDFGVLASGQRQAECYSVSGGITNKSILTWGNPKQ